MSGIKVTPLHPTFGAELSGVDFTKRVSPELYAEIRKVVDKVRNTRPLIGRGQRNAPWPYRADLGSTARSLSGTPNSRTRLTSNSRDILESWTMSRPTWMLAENTVFQ
jgi:hypothetical protein